MTLTEKVAYIKGLVDGLKLEDNDTNKVLGAIIDLLDDMALCVSDLEDEVDVIGEQVDAVDEDLSDLEEFVYEELDDCDFDDFDEDGCDCDCCDCDECCFDVECPTCGEAFCVDEETLCEGKVNCPKCNELLEFGFDDEDEDEE